MFLLFKETPLHLHLTHLSFENLDFPSVFNLISFTFIAPFFFVLMNSFKIVSCSWFRNVSSLKVKYLKMSLNNSYNELKEWQVIKYRVYSITSFASLQWKCKGTHRVISLQTQPLFYKCSMWVGWKNTLITLSTADILLKQNITNNLLLVP